MIGRFESGGVRDPRLSMIFQICQAMDLEPSEVLVKAGVTKAGNENEAKNLAGARRKANKLKRVVEEQTKAVDELIELL